MRISLNWLKEYVDIAVDPDQLARDMTMLGLEIEAIERPGADITQVYVGQILSIEQHPNADNLVVCKTDVGQGEPLQIICGAKNMKAGDKVPTAIVGAKLAGGFEISKRKMRGVESYGMMCAADELGLGEDHSGLIIMDPDIPVGRDAKPYLGLDDVIFEIEVLPNRGDWASMIGVARELAARYGTPLRLPQISLRESGEPASKYSSVTNDAPDLCPRYIGRVLRNVTIGPSPAWMCKRLLAAGQRPINNVVDVTNYVLLETGHPLHAFDYNLLAEHRIVVRRAHAGETMRTLDGETRVLTEQMLVIADAGRPQAVAGIMGGENSEVGEGTASVFLESAYFDPVSIRRTSRALGLMTESSQRFQRGADPEMARTAIDRAAALMQELAGAEIAQGVLDAYPAPLPRREVTLRYARNNALLGAEVPPDSQRGYLTGLGFEITSTTPEACAVRVPTWRHDVAQEADLIEEVARFHGFGQFPATVPSVPPVEQRFAPEHRILGGLRRLLVGYGLTEVCNWTFSSEDDVRKAGLEEAYLDMVRLQNPLSERQATMRSSLLPGLIHNVGLNVRHGSANLALFEIGPVYRPRPGQDLPDEPPTLGVALSGAADAQHWSHSQRPADFYDLKGVAETVLAYFQAEATFAPLESKVFLQGQAAVVTVHDAIIGRCGRLHPQVLRQFDIPQDVYLLELTLSPLLQRKTRHPQFQTFPTYPPSLRDLAVVVDDAVSAGALRDTAQRAGGKILERVDIFDVYRGKPVPAGKKSVALGFVFQSAERTLTDADTQKACDKILKALQREHKAELR
ncbi:MAG: phenylalanine--tRNA ligase subunit beta [Candidatus Hydrogenedentes bacterium]|nr:phenylalanine--tRNA ligase subunit beta [Candidatus Hydrogenedentota bacterium]